jgi:tRNA modification GTPase
VLREEVAAVLYGAANAGKSSIFNMLVGSPEALVEAAPGTTRDFLEAEVELEGVRFLLVDTAGVRTPAEVVEAIAVERSVDKAAQAQLVLFVADASASLDDETARLYRTARDVPHIVVLNKTDLPRAVTADHWRERFGDGPVIEFSATTGEGARELEIAMARAVIGGDLDLSGSRFLIEERHRAGLEDSLAALGRSREAVENDRGDEFVALELREAAEVIGRIIGRGYAEDLLGAVFSRFCIGK